jgi:hypothetical protein
MWLIFEVLIRYHIQTMWAYNQTTKHNLADPLAGWHCSQMAIWSDRYSATVHTSEYYWVTEVLPVLNQAPRRKDVSLLTSAPDGILSFTPLPRYHRERTTSTRWIWGWLGTGADLDIMEKRTISRFWRESNPVAIPTPFRTISVYISSIFKP